MTVLFCVLFVYTESKNTMYSRIDMRIHVETVSGVTLYQGAPGSKFSKAPLVEVLKARVEHRICTSFLGPGHVHPEKF